MLILFNGGFMILYKNYKNNLLFIFFYWFICLVMYLKTFDVRYVTLSWNVVLAMLPLIFIIRALITIKEKKLKRSIFWIFLWLFFFSNFV